MGLLNNIAGQSQGLQGEIWNVLDFTDGDFYTGTHVMDLLILLAKLTKPCSGVNS